MSAAQYQVEFIYRHDDLAGGVLRSPQQDPMQWSSIRSRDKWYVSLHSDLRTWNREQIRAIIETIQRHLQMRLVA